MNFKDIVRLMRPRQWTKNLAVFAAVVFSGELTQSSALTLTVLAFVALCFVSSSLYAANDALDAERDRAHPLKRDRPVASGRVTGLQAWVLAAGLAAIGFAGSWIIGPEFLAMVALYFALQVAYMAGLKNLVIIDMLVIALGFTVRAVAGAAAIDVPVSPWLVICTGLLALFLAAAKRRHELLLLGDDAGSHRPVLTEYSAELLDSFMVTLSAATITSYCLYTFFEGGGPGYAMMLTIPFVMYGVLRYQYLVLSKNVGGRPEDVLLGDIPTVVTVVLWGASAIVVLYVL